MSYKPKQENIKKLKIYLNEQKSKKQRINKQPKEE